MIALLFVAQPANCQSGVEAIPYVVDQVVPLQISPGFAAVIEFASDESVDNVVVGNSAVWQVTPNRRGDRLVVKPQANAETTNMIVVTDIRRYIFRLDVGQDGSGTPSVFRFEYPASSPTKVPARGVAGVYRLKGAKILYPDAMSDDGERTTITWERDLDLPAVFAVNGKDTETLVNGRMVGDDYVVEGVAQRYVFRAGKSRATATRAAPSDR